MTTNPLYLFSGEELKFFEGNSPCKGTVCIKTFDEKASCLNKKKDIDICSAMQCGSLDPSFETEQNTSYVICSGAVDVTPQCLIVLTLHL